MFQSLISDPAVAPFVLKALRSIQEHSGECGSPFLWREVPGSLRKDVVALAGDRQLWLFWNPAMDPIEVILHLR